MERESERDVGREEERVMREVKINTRLRMRDVGNVGERDRKRDRWVERKKEKERRND